MDNKKFEQLIDLIINENEEQARALFHDIVVEKSREIYESMMDEDDMMNQPSGPVEDLLDEIGSEESGMSEDEDEEFDIDDMDDDGEETIDIDMDDEEGGEEGLEDRVVDLEDKLDQLMAEFEEIMGGDDDMGDMDGDDMDGMDDMAGDDMDGETSVKGAGSFKNSPAQNNADLTAAPKPVTKDEAGKVRSPVAESRRTTAKRRI
jgi:hypothetical protein